MQILICVDKFYVHGGGAEMFAIRLANGLVNSCSIHFMVLDRPHNHEDRQSNLINSTIPLFEPDKDWIRSLVHLRGMLRIIQILGIFSLVTKYLSLRKKNRTIKYIHDNSIVIINSHGPSCNKYLSSLKRECSFKLVTSLHGHYELLRKKWNNEGKFREFMGDQIHSLDKVIYTTNDQLNTFSEFGYSDLKMSKLFYGFEFKKEYPPVLNERLPLRLVIVSRGDVRKGWLEVIAAVESLNESGKEVVLEIVGDGVMYDELSEKYAESGRILFHGYQQNVENYIARAHVAVLTTYYEAESMPNSIIEYLAMGKPVISTTIGAIPEMILTDDDEKAGTLIPTKRGLKPDVGDITKAIDFYYCNPNEIARQSKLAVKAFRKFSMDRCVDSYKKVFEKMVNSH